MKWRDPEDLEQWVMDQATIEKEIKHEWWQALEGLEGE